jgi:ABC-type glycerol-3-phosphate transport system substrate-binding protein
MTSKRLSRRDFLRLGAMTGAGAVLAACATGTDQPAAEPAGEEEAGAEPAASEGALIRYWTGWGGDWSGKTWEALQATATFNEMFKPGEVELKGAVPYEAFLTAIAGGEPPDGASNIQYVDYMARDVLLPLESHVATSTRIKKDDFVEGNWNQGFFKGVQLGIPGIECFLQYGLDYNTRMVEEAGLDPDNPPVTWEDVAVWNEKLTKFDAAGNLLQIGLDPYDAMAGGLWDTSAFFVPLSWGWDWWNAETGEFDLDNEKMVDALTTMSEMVKLMGVDKLAGLHAVEGQGQWGDSFNAEVQAMIIEGYWHPGETQAAMPDVAQFNRATYVPVPSSRRDAKCQGTGGHLVVLMKEAKNPDGMFKVAEFLNTPEACDVIFKSIGWLPAVKSYIASADPTAYPGLDFYFRSVEEANDWRGPEPCPITEYINTQFVELHEKVDRDEMTAAEAATELQRRAVDEYQAEFGS